MNGNYQTISSIVGFGLSLLSLDVNSVNAASIQFKYGDYVDYKRSKTGQLLYVWDQPCGANLLGTVPNGSFGQIKSPNHTVASCFGGTYDWYYTSFLGQETGWVAGDFLVNSIGLLGINQKATVRSTPGSGLHIWSQPGGGSNLGFLQPGTTVTVREKGPTLNVFGGNYNWFRIDQGWVAGEFLQANISSVSPPPPPPPFTPASLIFVDYQENWNEIDLIPGLDHVALDFGGRIYESTNLKSQQGVMKKRTRQDIEANPKLSIPNEINLDPKLGKAMKDKIDTKIGAKYAQLKSLPGMINQNWTPDKQKGSNGEFTCVGLIEWAAEQIGYNKGQGFISNSLEYIEVSYQVPEVYWDGWMPKIKMKTITQKVPTLTPSLLYNAITNPNKFNKGGLHGLFDPVDFILTDPLGRRVGYTEQLGLINEIPEAFYTGDAWAEQFFVPDLAPGDYSLQLFGLDDEATVAFGNSTGGSYFSGYLARGETHTLTFTVPGNSKSVPESSNTLSLLALGTVGVGSLIKRKQQRKYLNSSVS